MSDALNRDLAVLGLTVEGIAATNSRLDLEEGISSGVAAPATPGTKTEGSRVIRVGHGTKKKLHKGTSSDRRAWRMANKKRRSKRKSYSRRNKKRIAKRRRFLQKFEGILRPMKETLKHLFTQAEGYVKRGGAVAFESRAVQLRSKALPTDGLAGMIESLQDLEQSRSVVRNEEVVQAFSRLSVLSNDLSTHFEEFAPDFEEHAMAEELTMVGEFFGALSEELALGTKNLDEGVNDRFHLEGLWGEFQPRLALVQEGLTLFAVMEGLLSEKEMKALEGDDDDYPGEEGDEKTRPPGQPSGMEGKRGKGRTK